MKKEKQVITYRLTIAISYIVITINTNTNKTQK